MSAVEQYRLMDPATLADPYEYYQAMRETAPVHFDPSLGMYIVSRYEDIQDVLQRSDTFSQELGFKGQMSSPFDGIMDEVLTREGHGPWVPALITDPPYHTRIRALMDQSFNAQNVSNMEGYITEIVNELIDTFIGRGEFDVVNEYAQSIPINVISDWLGVDRTLRDKFPKWADAATARFGRVLNTPEQAVANARVEAEFQRIMKGYIDVRRAEPRDDMISKLVHARLQGHENSCLNERELLSILNALLVGGTETTAGAISSSVLLFAREPEIVARLRSSPDQTRAYLRFTEELLRRESPLLGSTRAAFVDTTVGGVKIPKDALIFLAHASGNRDEAKFGCPMKFDPQRANVGTQGAFGGGIHRCIGSVLARAEIRIAARELLKRADHFRVLTPQNELRGRPTVITHSVTKLKVAFTAIPA